MQDRVLRHEPNTGATVIGGLAAQTEATVLERRAEWARVQSDQGAEGWTEIGEG